MITTSPFAASNGANASMSFSVSSFLQLLKRMFSFMTAPMSVRIASLFSNTAFSSYAGPPPSTLSASHTAARPLGASSA